MITIKKLASLKPRTMIRKAAGIFYLYAREVEQKKSPDMDYLGELAGFVLGNETFAPFREKISAKYDSVMNNDDAVRNLDSLYYLLLASLGESPADWDLRYKSSGTALKRKPFQLYLDDIRSPFNIGSIFRTADSFGVSRILLSPDCPSPDHPRCRRTAMGCTEQIPWEICSIESLQLPLFALEVGGTMISSFSFPPKGTLIIGSEEAGISRKARELALSSAGIVSIPTHGSKGSLNLSVAAGIALFHWDSRC